jgi:hypothetical protein
VSREIQPVELVHDDVPPSLNQLGSGNRFKFWRVKKQWQATLGQLLLASELPTGLERVSVECEMTFPDRRRRDEGNFRFFLEKALGDALVSGGWLADDDGSRFSFGAVVFRYERGVRRVRLSLFPSGGLLTTHRGCGGAVEWVDHANGIRDGPLAEPHGPP